ncbi:M48 family metallopeptidase [Epilithonimonas zeae]|uniref:Peptidase family M48 n=1 Tax=Epilithonimonas zeae TaxID=1416779 RepID=A0A1N6IH08_9FLAO|nr:M48 family metallopeptidase [Epilithonimonas zeae]SIO31317.1 Peptidase family M48 [Epilithonimonas zeae]
MNRFLLVLMLSIFSFSNAQNNYKPIDTADYLQRKSFLTTYIKDSETYNKKQKDKYEGKTGREISAALSRFQKDFQDEVKNKNFVFNTGFNHYVNQMVEQILKSNSLDFPNLKVLVEKDNSPNAYCMGDGTLVVNMGLFNWVDNEGQLASVICHELGHLFLDHSIKIQLENIQLGKDGKAEAKTLTLVQNNKGEKAHQFYKRQLYKFSAQKRKQENEADSLGYIYYQKSNFSKPDFRKALLNLKKYDTISPKIVKAETYKQFFDLPNHPFKEQWMKKEDFSGYDYSHYKEKIDKDSVASHPEIEARIQYLDKHFPLQDLVSKEEPKPDFIDLQKIAKMEVLPNFYQSEDYGVGIYSALQFLQKEDPDIDYYKYWLGKNFEKIYEARKNYKLNRYLDRVDPKNQSESYQQFLNFMWNLSLDDIKYITEFYNKKSL